MYLCTLVHFPKLTTAEVFKKSFHIVYPNLTMRDLFAFLLANYFKHYAGYFKTLVNLLDVFFNKDCFQTFCVVKVKEFLMLLNKEVPVD